MKDGGFFNQLLIGQDVPDAWDNWNINYDLLGNLKPNARLISQTVVADGPLQLRLKLDYEMGQGTKLTQHVVFHAASPQVDFENLLDWHETHQFLKVGFDTSLHADFARYETQFGYLERPTHQNTALDRARFEFSVQKWADLSENDFGIALLNDCKYGMSGMGSSMQLSLLKSGTHPDPRGDAGLHRFTYSLLPHQGNFAVESVVRPAYELNTLPVTSISAEPVEMGPFISVDSPNIIIEAVKWAESGKGFVVRLYEASKSATETKITLPANVKEIWSVNLLEDKQEEVKMKNGKATIRLHAFEIKTLLCLV